MAAAPAARGGGGVADLGVLDGRLLLFGGVYSNLQALEALVAVCRDELRIPPERVIHTGDVVAYCAQPREATELLMSTGYHCLAGNCEESVSAGSHDCGCGFPEDSKCAEYSRNWYAHVSRELKNHPELVEWMGSLPKRIDFEIGGRRFAVCHGSPRNVSEFLWPSTPDEELRACLEPWAGLGIDGVISGHSGIPWARLVPRRGGGRCGPEESLLWVNAGVIGMPANDGTSRGWYALLTPGPAGLEVTVHALHFDAKGAAEALNACDRLDRAYADALLGGVWPSHDMLPLEEQMTTGQPLEEPPALLWPARPQGAAGGGLAQTLPTLLLNPGAVASLAAVALGVAAVSWSVLSARRARAA